MSSFFNFVFKTKSKEEEEPPLQPEEKAPLPPQDNSNDLYYECPDRDEDIRLDSFMNKRNSYDRMSVSRSGRFKRKSLRRSSLFDNPEMIPEDTNHIDNMSKKTPKEAQVIPDPDYVANRENHNPDNIYAELTKPELLVEASPKINFDDSMNSGTETESAYESVLI